MSHRAISSWTALVFFGAALCGTAVFASDVVVCRVGDGAAALTSAATPVFLERYTSDGTLVATVVLPTVANGSNQPITLSGTATSEGALAISADGQFITLAGYAAAVGTTSVAGTESATINRVVARMDAAGNVDASTRLTAAFNTSNVRAAVTADGSAFWLAGGAGGAWYAVLGTTGGETQIVSSPSNARALGIFAGQLYGSSGSAPFTNVFTIGAGLPTTSGQTATSLTGLPTSAASPYAFALLNRDVSVPGVDTLYLSDDRSIASGGGIQKWTFNGTTWTQATFAPQLPTGVRGLAAVVAGANVVVYTTTTGSPSALVRIVDDGSPSPQATVIATAPANTVYRGVALDPDSIFRNGFD